MIALYKDAVDGIFANKRAMMAPQAVPSQRSAHDAVFVCRAWYLTFGIRSKVIISSYNAVFMSSCMDHFFV